MKHVLLLSLAMTAVTLTGCQSGQQLGYESVSQIQRNVTTEAQIRAMYGEPEAVSIDYQAGTKTLLYRYRNNDEVKRYGAGILGSIAGGALGYQIGDGAGQAIATTIGSVAGGAIGGNSVSTREENQTLTVITSLANTQVIDFQYTENNYKDPAWRPASTPPAL